MTITIETGIPAPAPPASPKIERRVPAPAVSSYRKLFDQMQPGDSFVVTSDRERYRARSLFYWYIKQTDRFPEGTRIVTRIEGEPDELGRLALNRYRLWIVTPEEDC
jgi:hypothetical protein